MDKYEVATLAEDYETKRMRFQALGMQNTYGLSADERTKQAIEYHVAEAEMMQAYKALNAAKVS